MTDKKLLALRKRIDKIDESLIKKLALRQQLAIAIGQQKQKSGASVTDLVREKNQKKNYLRLCRQLQLDRPYIITIFNVIIAHSRELQKNVNKPQTGLRQSSGSRRQK